MWGRPEHVLFYSGKAIHNPMCVAVNIIKTTHSPPARFSRFLNWWHYLLAAPVSSL